jgi:hypothetical protein
MLPQADCSGDTAFQPKTGEVRPKTFFGILDTGKWVHGLGEDLSGKGAPVRAFRFGSCCVGGHGVLILEHGAKLFAQFRRVLVPVDSRGVQHAEFYHFVFGASDGN